MTKPTNPGTLLDDLEAIHQSLKKVTDNELSIPTLEEIVGHRAPKTVNRDNPFLSSSSLSELIRIRNEAENNVEAIITANANATNTTIGKTDERTNTPANKGRTNNKANSPHHRRNTGAARRSNDRLPTKAPNPEQIMHQMEVLFDRWIDSSVEQYMSLFESELRNRLQQDFRGLVMQWYRDHDLPIPKSFTDPSRHDSNEL